MACWLVKTEPGEYAYRDLADAGRARWDGVRNAQALQNLRAMEVDDRVAVYHTGRERRVVGWARVAAAAYPDPGAEDPRFVAVDLEACGELPNPVSLSALRNEPDFSGSPLLRQGRLSVVPLEPEQYRRLEELAGKGQGE